jgi:hypothetical protein
MKTLMYFFVMALIVMTGCAKDDTMPETQDNLELKKAKVPIPFKADCWIIPDWESVPILIEGLNPNDPNSYSLNRLFIGGTSTHLGRINAEESYYLFDRIVFGVDEDGMLCTHLTGVGKMVGANGDGIEFTFSSRQYLDSRFFGKAEIIPGSGTGKFKGSTGSLDTSGGRNEDEIWLKAQGYLVYE